MAWNAADPTQVVGGRHLWTVRALLDPVAGDAAFLAHVSLRRRHDGWTYSTALVREVLDGIPDRLGGLDKRSLFAIQMTLAYPVALYQTFKGKLWEILRGSLP